MAIGYAFRWGNGSNAASKCRAIATRAKASGSQQQNPRNGNLPVKDDGIIRFE
jgi:hypothetical protein